MKRDIYVLILLVAGLYFSSFTAKADTWQEFIASSGNEPVSGTDYSCGSNYADFKVKSAKGLAYLAQIVNSGACTFKAMPVEIQADIDLSGHNWIPIGTPDHPFMGSISNGKIISNMVVSQESVGDAYAGLFGYVKAEKSSVYIDNVKLIKSTDGSVSAVSSTGNAYAGGLIGYVKIIGTTITIKNCRNGTSSEIGLEVFAKTNSSNSSSLAVAAGIVGYFDASDESNATMNIADCVNYGEINSYAYEGSSMAAGFIGCYKSQGDLVISTTQISSYGNIYSESSDGNAYAGGVICELDCSGTGSIEIGGEVTVSGITIEAVAKNGTSIAGGLMSTVDIDGSFAKATLNTNSSMSDITLSGDIVSIAIGTGSGLELSGGITNTISNIVVGTVIDLDQLQNYKNRSAEGIEVSDDNATLTLSGNNNFTIKNGSVKGITVIANNTGKLHCDKAYMSVLELGATATHSATQLTDTNTGSVILYDGCELSQIGINNSGDITYSRVFTAFNSGNGDGWQSICLPFNAVMYADSDACYHFTSESTSASYWLYEVSESDGEYVEFTFPSKNTLEAFTPYIIALPGAGFGSESLQGKKISFKGTGIIKPSDYLNVGTSGKYNMKSTGVIKKTFSDVYVLDCCDEFLSGVTGAGTGYIKYSELDNVIIKPFRTYIKVSQETSSSLRFRFVDVASSLKLEKTDSSSTVRIRKDGQTLYVSATQRQHIVIYSSLGLAVKDLGMVEDEICVEGLNSGLYIVGGKKIVL